jgi:manganese-dependent inorganic pyrophosphatase
VEIPKDIAGIMLSSIISDTLLFTSPTTTEADKKVANSLAAIAEVDIKKYGIKMLKAASSVKDLTVNEQIFQDYKSYTVGDQKIGIGQLITLDFEELSNNIDEYVKRLNELKSVHPGVYLLFVTDILSNGSYVIYDSDSEEIIKDSFNLDHVEQGIFIKGLVSRKKQILPPIMERME